MNTLIASRERNKENDLVFAVLSYASRCVAEGDIHAFRDISFQVEDIGIIERLSLADLQTLSTSRSTALNVARGYLENVRGRDPWSIAAEPVVRVDATGAVTPSGAYTRELLVTVDRANLLRLEVVVTGPGIAAPIRLITNAYRGGTMTPIL